MNKYAVSIDTMFSVEAESVEAAIEQARTDIEDQILLGEFLDNVSLKVVDSDE